MGTNFERPEVAALVRARIPIAPKFRFNLGGGFSYLHQYEAHEWNGLLALFRVFESIAEGSIQSTVTAPAYFANFEGGSEYRQNHLAFRVYIGITHLVNQTRSVCGPGYYPCNPSWGANLLYLGTSIGYAF